MARTVTTTAVKRIITKGLTGWQAGKLVLQDMVDTCLGNDGVLTEGDMAAIQQIRMEGTDVRDYNTFMALCRGFHRGYMLAEWACKDACLQIGFLDQALEDAERRRTVELFESCGPHLVTRKQYDEIVTAQREKKLAFEFGLGYVIEERFYAIAPPEARSAIDEADVDVESAADFMAVVPEAYRDLCEQAVDQIRRLYVDRKLPVVYDEKEAKEIKPLLTRWKKGRLSPKETMKLALESLHPQDTFNLITFAGDTHILFPSPAPAREANLRRAQEILAARRGSGSRSCGTAWAAVAGARRSSRGTPTARRGVRWCTRWTLATISWRWSPARTCPKGSLTPRSFCAAPRWRASSHGFFRSRARSDLVSRRASGRSFCRPPCPGSSSRSVLPPALR